MIVTYVSGIVYLAHHSKLKGQWDEKVVVIGSLEQDLSRVQQSFSEREGRLAEEKERAVERAR